ncbi:MAG: prepilin peptidase [Deltaproteobacteria bacterium]|nr:prepilin peptidase [Deltaproteobacteria bacterium]
MPPLPVIARLYGPEIAHDPMVVIFFGAAAFAFGAVIGSFLNVCIARLPAMSLVAQYREGDEPLRREIIESIDDDPKRALALMEEMQRDNVGLARPRSRCPACRKTIAWYDNVPIASWLLLRARCRECGERSAACIRSSKRSPVLRRRISSCNSA